MKQFSAKQTQFNGSQPRRRIAGRQLIAGADMREVLLGFAVGSSGMALFLATVAALYIAKSAAGVNLIAGPSFLHDYLYPFVRML